MRILLAEDDAQLADAISRALLKSAHAVDVARDGTQALMFTALESVEQRRRPLRCSPPRPAPAG